MLELWLTYRTPTYLSSPLKICSSTLSVFVKPFMVGTPGSVLIVVAWQPASPPAPLKATLEALAVPALPVVPAPPETPPLDPLA